MEYCLYTTRSGAVYAAVSFVNWAVPLFISGSAFVKDQRSGRVGKQFTLVAFGIYLFFWQFVLYVLQTALRVERPDPFCPAMMTDGFPSGAAFFTAVGGSTIFALTRLLDFSLSWVSVVWVVAWWIAPPVVLVWFGFNAWQEVLLSLGLGVLATALFFATLHYVLRDMLPYVLNQTPWAQLGCIDTWVQSERGQSRTEEVRAWLEAAER